MLPLLVLLTTVPVLAAPAALLPSLAKINGLLDQARDLERKQDFAPVIPLYAQVLRELGDTPPRHMRHIAAKALVQTGNAQLAVGKLDLAVAAYQDAVTRFGAANEPEIRQHTDRARVLVRRVAEIQLMQQGSTPSQPSGGGVVTAPLTPPTHEPLLLLTQRNPPAGGSSGDTPGYVVRSFEGDEATLIRDAQRQATGSGAKILAMGADMIRAGLVLVGSCWDYIDAVYNKCGYTDQKRTVISKSPKNGPFVDVRLVRPGDWLYYRNHSYNDIEHSGIFVGWINANGKVALILSYPGMDRHEPGRYRPYEISSVFRITRGATI